MLSWPEFEGKRVLTVDDARAIRIYLQDVLARRGARVSEAGSGQEALALWGGEERFDLILLDLILPDLDGIGVLERIRERDLETPVVVITGAGGLQSATEAMLKGADGYIEKQHLATDDDVPLLHALRQAMEHRAGLVAQRELQELRTEFYSMVTHDLRNPAGSVWGIIRMLLGGKAGPLTEKQVQLLSIAQSSASKLVSLINDYLDYAKIEAGYLRVERREADLREVVRAAARLAEPQAGLRRQTLALDLPAEPVTAAVDAERMEQVLDNLISNALKYTPEEGSIRVMLRREGPEVVISVSDTGAGIPPEQLGNLFTPFHRIPGDSTRGIRGTGLGLSIVKEIVEAHSGSVSVSSEGVPGRGSTFEVRIPVEPA